MGIVEAVILFIYALASTGYNLHQASEIGELGAERDRYKAIADKCQQFDQQGADAAYRAANRKATAQALASEATSEYRESMADHLSDDSNPCFNTPSGIDYDGVLDDERRFLEKLRQPRLPTKP